MSVKLTNNASSRLSVTITTSSTTISVQAGDGAKFPALSDVADWFPVTLVKATGELEICKCTARSGDVLTVQRAQEGTSAKAFNAGDRVELRLTTATLDSRLSEKFDKTGGNLTGDVKIEKSLPKITLKDNDTTLTDNQEVAAIDVESVDADTPGIGARIRALADQAAGKLKWVLSAGLPSSLIDVLTLKDTGAIIAGSLSVSGRATMGNLVTFAKGADIATGSTIDLTAATGNIVTITGSGTITAWTMNVGQVMEVIFRDTPTLTHNLTTNKLPGLADITVNAGDTARFYYDGTTVYCLQYQRLDGTAVRDYPAGAVQHFAMATAPQGWIVANGTAALRSQYPALSAAIYCGDALNATALFGYRCTNPGSPSTSRSTSGSYFVLPDARAEFLRGFDAGRGVDSGRVFGSFQDHAMQTHTHPSAALSAASTSGTASGGNPVANNGSTTGNNTGNTASETRPRNIALLACVKT